MYSLLRKLIFLFDAETAHVFSLRFLSIAQSAGLLRLFLKQRIDHIKQLFPETTLHAIAAKANPLPAILDFLQPLNVGVEAATLSEAYLAQKSGYEGHEEMIFFIPGIDYHTAFEFGNRYQQQSILWKDENIFGIVYTNNFTDEEGVQRQKNEKGKAHSTYT